ncbi:hypothetical protein TWF694_004054 [Orbilia ellipsospora]|uniref:Extracellular membrane protein CFEM domain-containing protein n=1 Tax=Orbilia ellipsospora TaxID=2528407 RepID=A0AAV9WY77_9PEZI
MSTTPSLPILTKWPCAATCITAYDGFCERFTYTGIWPATAQCLLSSCSDQDRLALQETVSKYCDAVGYPDVWGPYMWGAPVASSSSNSPSSAATSTKGSVTSSAAPTTSPSSTAIPTTFATVPTANTLAQAGVSSTSLPTATTVAASSDNQGSTKSSGVSVGAKAGIGIGIAIGFLLIISVILFFLRWRKKQLAANFPEGPDHFATPTASPREKEFGNDDVIIYTIEGGTLKKKNEKRLSIKVI